MDGGPKSLNAGLKFDDEGKDGEGTEEPGQTEGTLITTTDVITFASEIVLVLFCLKLAAKLKLTDAHCLNSQRHKKQMVGTWWCVVGASWCRSYGFITHGDIG